MRKHKKLIAVSIAAVLLVYLVLLAVNWMLARPAPDTNPIELTALQNNPIDDQPIVDRMEYDNDPAPRSIYVTVYPGTNKYGTKTYTLADLQATSKYGLGPDEPEAYANVKVGSPDGVEGQLGYGTDAINASIKLRGHSTRTSDWKSYKLKLYDAAGLYQGQDVINLNKHPSQGTQLLNKLCFDLFTTVPDFTSVNTNFVHVYIRDCSKEEPDEDYVDYGLFTQVEEPDKSFLEKHGLDPNGMLYKAENFEFFRYPDQLKSQLDPDYNEAQFETRLGILNGDDHRKFIAMLDAINDINRDINEAFDQYFDRDNYLTWLAVNILLGNLDTTNQNFLLYSPANSQKWYFLPWDYDGSLRDTELFTTNYSWMHKSLQGIHRYMSVQLHKRMMSDPENRQQLSDKINEIYEHYINPHTVDALVQSYLASVGETFLSEPDLGTVLFNKPQMFLDYCNELKGNVTGNYENYFVTLDYPAPFFIEPVRVQDGQVTFEWSESVDFAGTAMHYTLDILTDIEEETVVYAKQNLNSGKLTITPSEVGLAPGTYYVRVRAYNGLGREQFAYNEIKSKYRYGYIRFKITE